MDLHTVIGLAGVAGYATSYLMLQLGFLDGNGVRYSVANVLAAALVLVSLTDEFNLASAMIQVIWIVIGVSGLVLRVVRKQSNSATEKAVVEPTSDGDVVGVAGAAMPSRASARRSPFRVASAGVPSLARSTSVSGSPSAYGLVPDGVRRTGLTTGLRADVLDAYQAARAADRTS